MKEIAFHSLKNSLFETKAEFYADDSGLKVNCPSNGYLVIFDLINNPHNPTEYVNDVVLVEKKKLFAKHNVGRYKAYSVSTVSLNAKGYTTKMGFDISCDGVSIDIAISYDYSFRAARGRFAQFKNFVDSNGIGNEANGDRYKDILNPYIEKVVKNVVGNSLRNKCIEDVETDVVNLSNDVKNMLNSSSVEMYEFGLEITAFAMRSNDDYEHRQEKKRIEHNVALKNR